jgi:DNA topoisomerase-1
MRTDSLNLSKYALASTASEIEKRFGKEYVKVRTYATKSKSAQEAHEAIRPTKMSAQDLGQDRDQKRLYRLIWQRTMASQMAPAQVEKTSILIAVSDSDYFFKTD